MELNEAAVRIFKVHGILILALVVLGLEAGMLIARMQPAMYTATAHVALVVGDPRVGVVDSSSVADTGRAIVTSPSHVQSALDKVGVQRDVHTLIQNRISLQSEGTSGVVSLSVRDRDPNVASSLTNALANDMVATYRGASGDDVQQLIAGLDGQVASLDGQIADADGRYQAAVSTIAAAQQQDAQFALYLSPYNVAAERQNLAQEQSAITQRDQIQRQIDQLETERNTLLLQRGSLVAGQALAPRPAVIDAAAAPTQADPSPAPLDLALGGLAGLILGIALAACIESFRPTLVGRFGISRAADAPFLAALQHRPESVKPSELLLLKKGVGLAAAASKVKAVELVAAGPEADLTNMAFHLSGTDNLLVRPYGANGVHRNGHRTGVVVVAPTTLSRERMADVSNLQAITDWPVLGVVTYPTPTAAQRSAAGLRRLVDSVKPRAKSPAATTAPEEHKEEE